MDIEEDFCAGRTSLENQITDARKRAELFSKSLQDARHQEAEALRALEQERMRWTHSFEEKSVMIEQLERELSSTVRALDVERAEYDFAPNNENLASITGSNPHLLDPTLIADVDIDFLNHRLLHGGHQQSDAPAQSKSKSVAHNTATSTYVNNMSGVASAPVRSENSIWKDLLAQYQEQLREARGEVEAGTIQREQLLAEVAQHKKLLQDSEEEVVQLKLACRNCEGKLQFRVAQVIEFESERQQWAVKESRMSAEAAELRNQIVSLRQELVVARAELHALSPTRGGTEPADSSMLDLKNSGALSAGLGEQLDRNSANSARLAKETSAHLLDMQLAEAKAVSMQLQIQLKDSERAQQLLLGRCEQAEGQMDKVEAERDLLLGLVNKFSSLGSSTLASNEERREEKREASSARDHQQAAATGESAGVTAERSANSDESRPHQGPLGLGSRSSISSSPVEAAGTVHKRGMFSATTDVSNGKTKVAVVVPRSFSAASEVEIDDRQDWSHAAIVASSNSADIKAVAACDSSFINMDSGSESAECDDSKKISQSSAVGSRTECRPPNSIHRKRKSDLRKVKTKCSTSQDDTSKLRANPRAHNYAPAKSSPASSNINKYKHQVSRPTTPAATLVKPKTANHVEGDTRHRIPSRSGSAVKRSQQQGSNFTGEKAKESVKLRGRSNSFGSAVAVVKSGESLAAAGSLRADELFVRPDALNSAPGLESCESIVDTTAAADEGSNAEKSHSSLPIAPSSGSTIPAAGMTKAAGKKKPRTEVPAARVARLRHTSSYLQPTENSKLRSASSAEP